jgi:hypothetical protein
VSFYFPKTFELAGSRLILLLSLGVELWSGERLAHIRTSGDSGFVRRLIEDVAQNGIRFYSA